MNVVCSHCKKEWKGLDHLRKDFKQGDFILYSITLLQLVRDSS